MLVPPTLMACLVLGVALASRTLLHLLRVKGYGLRDRGRRRVLAIGSAEQAGHALALLWQTHYGLGRKGIVEATAVGPDATALHTRLRRERTDELVFCAADIPAARIIHWMEVLQRTRVQFKIAQPGGAVIGPNSAESLGDLLVLERHGIQSAAARRVKRTTDVAISLVLLATAPLSVWFVENGTGMLRNALAVLLGRCSWVGYSAPRGQRRLPPLAPAVVGTVAAWRGAVNDRVAGRLDLLYAKDHRVGFDLRCVLRSFRRLGGPVRG